MVTIAPKFGSNAINSALSGNTTQNCGLGSTVIELRRLSAAHTILQPMAKQRKAPQRLTPTSRARAAYDGGRIALKSAI
jgi:hypothetical protein